MTPTDISRRLAELFDDQMTLGPIAEDAVRDAETSLGVTFPPSYRLFLLQYGASKGPDVEFGGISDVWNPEKPPMFSSIVADTQQYRDGSGTADWPPPGYVAIATDCCECVYFLDTERIDADGEGEVVANEPGREDIFAAKNFIQFVERLHAGERP